MSVQPAGIADIQARIAQIQSQFSGLAVSTAGGSSAGVQDFSTALAQASSGIAQGNAISQPLATGDPTGVTGSSATGSGGTVTGAAVVSDAQRYLGVPYLWGGTDPSKGLDCSGLVQRVYADLGIQLPRVSQDQALAGQAVPSLAQAQPGDLVTFGSPATHIGIYIGNGQMIEAPHTGDVVKVAPVGTPTSIRRIVPDTTATATAAAGAVAGPAGRFATLFAAAGAKYGVSPALLSAVARAESGYDPSAVSPAGAQGLMQIMPSTAAGLGVNPMDPAQAVDGAARLLSGYLQQYGGATDLALAAYNAGPGAVARYGGVPPYAETQNYVQTVLGYANGSA